MFNSFFKSVKIIFIAGFTFAAASCNTEIAKNSLQKVISDESYLEGDFVSEDIEKPNKKSLDLFLNQINKNTFSAKSITGILSSSGKTLGNNDSGGVVLFGKNFDDFKNYEINMTGSGDGNVLIVKSKNGADYFVDRVEKLPVHLKFKYNKQDFTFDKIIILPYSANPIDISGEIKEVSDNAIEPFFGKVLDEVSCCYANRDLGAPGPGLHLGQDLKAFPGQNVYAAADAVVKSARTNSQGYATVVILEHTLPDDTIVQTIYGHLSKSLGLKVKNNQKVKKGQLLGYVGYDNENGDGAPHVHFGLKLGKWDGAYPGYCGKTSVNKIYSGSDYSGGCSSSSGRFVRPLSFMEEVNRTGKNPYPGLSK
ncbi:MAG: peptidoglycan DD-metalloendopeptidase family protein [Cyanobacteriota bacterium]